MSFAVDNNAVDGSFSPLSDAEGGYREVARGRETDYDQDVPRSEGGGSAWGGSSMGIAAGGGEAAVGTGGSAPVAGGTGEQPTTRDLRTCYRCGGQGHLAFICTTVSKYKPLPDEPHCPGCQGVSLV